MCDQLMSELIQVCYGKSPGYIKGYIIPIDEKTHGVRGGEVVGGRGGDLWGLVVAMPFLLPVIAVLA